MYNFTEGPLVVPHLHKGDVPRKSGAKKTYLHVLRPKAYLLFWQKLFVYIIIFKST